MLQVQIYLHNERCVHESTVQVEQLAVIHLMNFTIFLSFWLLHDHTLLCQWNAFIHHVNSYRVLLEELLNRIVLLLFGQHIY